MMLVTGQVQQEGRAHTDAEAVAYETLVAQSPDAMIFADISGQIRAWNAAAQRIFGHSAGDAIGQTLDLIVPEQFRQAHWTGFHRAVGEGTTKYEGQSLPTRSVGADGQQIYVELSFAIVQDASGNTIGALATARDITERFEHDRAERRRVREMEAELTELRGRGSG
jgi:PAS domain S-box-containing protein